MPIWGGSELLAPARADENQVFLVASGDNFNSAVYRKDGQPVATAAGDPEVITAIESASYFVTAPYAFTLARHPAVAIFTTSGTVSVRL